MPSQQRRGEWVGEIRIRRGGWVGEIRIRMPWGLLQMLNIKVFLRLGFDQCGSSSKFLKLESQG
jgi:hypothetical protein